MNVSEYIVDFLINNDIHHIYGYQGTMISYFVDAIGENELIENHCCYNEQAAAFAACGQAKVTGKIAVAYATSGPGALNLVSGIADAYYDSVPVLFITGQLNTTEYTEIPELRQQGFQQTDVVGIVSPITKYAIKIESVEQVSYELEKAVYIAMHGRKGPVLIDIPMDIQKSLLSENMQHFKYKQIELEMDAEIIADSIVAALNDSSRPVFLFGNGVDKDFESRKIINLLAEKYKIPIITSLLGKNLLCEDNPYNMGFIGAAYGHRHANIIAYEKADLIICLGCSLCRRQIGGNSEKFAENARIIRVDIDAIELKRKIHKDELSYVCDVNHVIRKLLNREICREFYEWGETCQKIKQLTESFDKKCEYREPNNYIKLISDLTPENVIVLSDVGQHQIWVAQSFSVKCGQRLLFSGGHGAMGFSLPASIGAHYSNNGKVAIVVGDGSLQMNIQEFQWIVRENIPVTIFVFNNDTLGLIQQQQDDFFEGKHFGSTKEGGYTAPSFKEIANSYGIVSTSVSTKSDLKEAIRRIGFKDFPSLIEIKIGSKTKAYPKTYFGETMNNQRPYMNKEILEEIEAL